MVVKDNQTIVLGGLIGETDSEVETKVPILGDLPLVGRIFRGRQVTRRKTNLLIFLTPHIISEPADLEEVYRVKVAQRQGLRRFYESRVRAGGRDAESPVLLDEPDRPAEPLPGSRHGRWQVQRHRRRDVGFHHRRPRDDRGAPEALDSAID